jgi:hypothetical protein
MEKDKCTTVVVFRKLNKDGGIIALFPYEQHVEHFITSYEHVGQHSGADYNYVVSISKLAKEDEYCDLKRELEDMGYNLIVRKRAKIRY